MTNTTQSYPAPLRDMIRDIARDGYAPTDIRQAAEFLRGEQLRDITVCTLTFRGKVVAMLANNAAPRTHRAFGIGSPAPIIEEIPTPELVAERAAADALVPAYPGATTERRSFAVCASCGFTNSDHAPSCARRWTFGWSWSYALSHTVRRGHAQIVEGRRWDDAAGAEAFRASLPEAIRFQLFVTPVREYVLRDARDSD